MEKKIYKSNDVCLILQEMLSYVLDCQANGENTNGYFQELTNTGLFIDACGKPIVGDDKEVIISIEY